MSEPLYNIVFYGTIQPGKGKKAIIEAMASMFKTEPAKILPYFSGDRRTIKADLNKATTLKYKAALEKIGLVVKIEKTGSDTRPAHAEPAKAGPKKKTQQKPQKRTDNSKPLTEAKAKAQAEAEAIGAQISTDGISMAEVGANVIEHSVEVTPQAIGDISDISVADAGADLIEHSVEVTPQAIGDISDISVSEVGVDLIEHPVEVTPQAIGDISDISVADAGVDLIEHPVEVTPQTIGDISDISVADVGADIIENPEPKEVEPLPDISELELE